MRAPSVLHVQLFIGIGGVGRQFDVVARQNRRGVHPEIITVFFDIRFSLVEVGGFDVYLRGNAGS
jgi:hypothetical protein